MNLFRLADKIVRRISTNRRLRAEKKRGSRISHAAMTAVGCLIGGCEPLHDCVSTTNAH